MLETLKTLFLAFTTWRSQVWNLAVNAMRRITHGTALGWVWVFVKPAMYIFCFWVALSIGLKGARVSGMDNASYIVWLASGIIPWFFLQSTISNGSNVFKKYSYLVNKLKFPVPLIPVFHELGQMMIHLMLLACLAVGYFLAGGHLTLYMLQIPILVVLMYIFGIGFSLMLSPLTAISTDVYNFIKAMMTPIFWLSGILFDATKIGPHLQWVLYFDPVSFLCEGYRKVFVDFPGYQGWLWDNPIYLGIGLGVIAATFVAGLLIYSRLRKDIPDVL